MLADQAAGCAGERRWRDLGGVILRKRCRAARRNHRALPASVAPDPDAVTASCSLLHATSATSANHLTYVFRVREGLRGFELRRYTKQHVFATVRGRELDADR